MKTKSEVGEKKLLLKAILKSDRVKAFPQLRKRVLNYSLQGLREELKWCEGYAREQKAGVRHNKY